MNRITKYLRVYRMLLKCALMKQMEYRVNFLLMIGIEGIFWSLNCYIRILYMIQE